MKEQFLRRGYRFFCKGIQLTRPEDAITEDGKYPLLENVRSYVDSSIVRRLGLSNPSATLGTGPIHSLRRFFDSTNNVVGDVVGSGTALYFITSGGVATEVDTGYTGLPLSLVTMRPLSAIDPRTYITDGVKLRKVDKTGVVRNVGLTPPNVAATTQLGAPQVAALEDFSSLPNGWTNGGTAGAISLLGGKRVDTTISHILYDTGATGWASVAPAVMNDEIQKGLIIKVAGGESVAVTDTFPAVRTTTIGAINYDAGSTGLCTIQLSGPSIEGLRKDAIVRIAGAENVRILSATIGPDGLPSFRCATVGTRSVGDSVQGLRSFRAYFTATQVVGATLRTEAFQTTITQGLGHIEKVGSFDLSSVATRPIQDEDDIHISIRLNLPSNLTEGKVMFNLDAASTAFDENYLYFPFSASSLVPAAEDTATTSTVQQDIIQRRLIDQEVGRFRFGRPLADVPFIDPIFDPPIVYPVDVVDPNAPLIPGETAAGDNQWTELTFKVKDLKRIGSDESKGLANVNAVRVQLNVESTVTMQVTSLWIGGTFGLDNSSTFPYIWTYRYRSSETGVVSNPAPPMRSGVTISRGRVIVTPVISPDPQVDLIDFFRQGGTLTEWHYVGTTPNSGSFTDLYADEEVSGTFGLDEDNFQPFPMLGEQVSGLCSVTGTEVTSAGLFDTRWARGSGIIINGTPTSLYATPQTSNRLSIEDNLGVLTNVPFVVPSPTVMAQSPTAIWGPYSVAGINFLFGCENGTLFYTKGNNPDAAPETSQLEVTSPSEPLIGGCVYDGQGYVFSTERMFRIIPTSQPEAIFEVQEVPIGKGLLTPWSLCVDEFIYFVSRDGIYSTNGTDLKNITDHDLYPLFPHDGQVGVEAPGFAPPDFSQRESLRLAAGDGLVKFTYRDTDGGLNTLVYDTKNKSWISKDSYNPSVTLHYWDEGGSTTGPFGIETRERVGTTTGVLYIANSGATDAGTVITGRVRTPLVYMDDTRSTKVFGDIMVDYRGDVGCTVFVDGFTSLVPSTALSIAATRTKEVVDINSGAGVRGVQLGLDLTLSDDTSTLFEWQPSYVNRKEGVKARWMEWDDDGNPETKYLQGVVIQADTQGQDVELLVKGDGDVTIGVITINHNGLSTHDYPGFGDTWTPQPTHMMRLVPQSGGIKWELNEVKWIYEPTPATAIKWQSQGTSHGFENYHHLRRAWIALSSTDDVTLLMNADGVNYTYTIPSTGGVYKKVLLKLQAAKGKLWTYTFTSPSPFRLYLQDSVVEALGWGEGGPYKNIRPFGDFHHNQTEARI